MFRAIFKKNVKLLFLAALTMFAASGQIFAQFTFNGDYDKTFAAPLGYQVDGQFPTPGQEVFTYNIGGVVNPDGSVVAGGRVARTANDRWDIYLRKFTASGAVDTSFGTNGFVRTVFSVDVPTNTEGNSIPAVIKGQADGKIIMGGICNVGRANAASNISFGTDWCLVRYNANGSIDTSFGNNIVQWGNTNSTVFNQTVGQGRVAIQTGINEDGTLGGSSSTLRDIAIQPDGKIVVVGETRDFLNPFFQGVGTARQSGLIVRFNANGSLDASFGTGGYARYSATNPVVPNCYPNRGFHGVTLQSDGRIIALGNDGTTPGSGSGCAYGNVFVVTRWSSNGILETARRLDGNTSVAAREKATAAIITKNGDKVLVSGSYQTRPTLLRMNLSDLSVDTGFGTNGIVGYAPIGGDGGQQSLYIKAIQPDGKILGVDTAGLLGNGIVRFNANGTGDLSFGNFGWDNNASFGRIRLSATWFRGNTPAFTASDLALRPDGRFLSFGQLTDGQVIRSFVSQHNTNSRSGNYSDFTNDGKADLSVYRNGVWYVLNSSNNSFSAVQFGISTDKLAPADYDGDGQTDRAVFRDGIWYVFRSSNNQVTVFQWGSAGDLPRPGDFNGDGQADFAVFRPSNGTWYIYYSNPVQPGNNAFNIVQFGANGDVPIIGDFDGDGKSDVSVFRNGVWYFIRSGSGTIGIVQFGSTGDVPVAGDYDGDSKADLAVFRNGVWYVLRSTDGGATIFSWGQAGDKAVPGDYDNDGRNDFAIYRNGIWWIYYTGNNSFTAISFGLATDTPIQTAFTQ